jgi:MFS family permease
MQRFRRSRTPNEQPDAPGEAMSRFAAFENRNYRRYFVGLTISSIGTWFTSLAVTWLVLEITNRSDKLGIAVALQFLPLLVLGAPAGALADRYDNRRLLLITSSILGTLALVFGIIVASGHVTIWWIYGFTLSVGMVLSVERPTMQAFVYQLVGPELLPRAVAANGTINGISRLIGPALAGVLIAAFGVKVNFFVDAASYVVIAIALLGLRREEFVHRPLGGRAKRRVREGLAYVRSHPEVARPLMVMTVVGTIALNFQTTMPSMVRFGFHLGAGPVGAVMSISAVGSVLGGIYIAGVEPHPRRTLSLVLAGFAVSLAAVAVAPNYWAFVVVSIPLGAASAAFQSLNTSILQRATEPAMQGRVMALHQMAWFGSTPIGALLMGWIIHITSARVPFALGSGAALVCAIGVLGRRSVRTAATA